jgi:pimeloyl-ACP methyl ester carboxylesterase
MGEPREFRLDIGEVELSVYEWNSGMSGGSPVLLLHATGFHARCWNQVVLQLPGRHIYAVDLRFHGNSGDYGEVDWGVLSEDIRILLERLELLDVVGVGHSIGGHLVTRAAVRAPERFRHLLLVDPVITTRDNYLKAAEVTASIHATDHPVSRRRNTWRDAEEMYQRFHDREPFNTWQPEVLRDYCDYALHPENEEGYRQLLCDPVNEASVYLNQAGNEVILEELPTLQTPVTLLRARSKGADFAAFADFSASPTWTELASIIPDCRDHYLPHLNHFIPMQDPALVAEHIERVLTL